ncbi:flagellar basal body rod protein FlgF [Pseudomonas sp. ZM23]|uniref:Flagellar basal-body rod protein FlgF n=1 Tax=Pseudomonas triclosanedens TaxID=2961893 RepID=A0ABY6ZZ89_9PSED|nr:flagellar basal body rod protein FlgF [Pseudomonas triclosanedens]MCP8462725.1 flagellar basal body rod protein FlgF [Pseudomonas triclosanedens]MCP8468344.1 flagellar basal body rod protein FlgF [Pseudomonas triclosanedens]MCP8475103.1 flagellar basal body rod protein FlgF [Pseudomonas triclosanedens]WAI49912.1 flagellar basal body rod protein FlgF [Pseudomonas triclosanedens]
MDRLGYTAMTAASRSMSALDVRANNLANVNTPGFRADLEHATAVDVKGAGYDSRHLARIESSGVDMTPGTLMATGRDLDFAIQGRGLIAVANGGSEAYTRQGNLEIDADRQLMINGRAVLGEGGPINLPEYDAIAIGSDGTISIMPRGDYLMTDVDRIKLVDAPAATLVKNAQGLLVSKDGQNVAASEDVRLVSGHLEASNVSAIDQLVGTMSLNRRFETQVKMMKAASDLAEAGDRLIRGG